MHEIDTLKETIRVLTDQNVSLGEEVRRLRAENAAFRPALGLLVPESVPASASPAAASVAAPAVPSRGKSLHLSDEARAVMARNNMGSGEFANVTTEAEARAIFKAREGATQARTVSMKSPNN